MIFGWEGGAGWPTHDLEAALRPSYVYTLDLSSLVLVLVLSGLPSFRVRISPLAISDLPLEGGGSLDSNERKLTATAGFQNTETASPPCKHDALRCVQT